MTKENQSNSDERIRKLNERFAELQVEVAQLKKENAEQMKETDKLLKTLIKEVTEQSRATDKRFDETAELQKAEADRWKETKEMIKENGKQIGGLGNKFGGYTEAMARPSIRRILEKRFEADYLGSIRFKSTKDIEALEIDAWGISRNSTGAAYIVETKSKFRDEHIGQIWNLVERFRAYHADYSERAVYPMLAVVEINEEERRKVWDAGIHLIDINDGVFEYAKPPRDFEAEGYHGAYGVQRSVPHLQLVVGRFHNQRDAG